MVRVFLTAYYKPIKFKIMSKVYLFCSSLACIIAARELCQDRILFAALALASAFVLLIKGGAANPEDNA